MDFNKIYSENNKLVLTYFTGRTNNLEVSQELTNDVFMKVYENLDSYDDGLASMQTWIMTIAKNILIDYYRKRKEDSVSIDQVFEVSGEGDEITLSESHHISSDETPMTMISSQEGYDHIQSLIRKLPADYHNVAIKFFNEEMSYAEISKALDIPISTVKIRLHRARFILKEQLEVA